MGRVRDAKNKASQQAYKANVVKKEAAKKVTIEQAFSRRRLLLEVRQEAAEFTTGLKRGQDPAEAIQIVLDNMMTAYEYATQQMMELPEDEYFVNTLGGLRLHHWIVEQERLGLQLAHIAGKAAGLGLAERTVRVHEAQAALFAAVVEQALKEAELTTEQRRLIHESIGSKLETIDSTAVDMPMLARSTQAA